MDATTATTKAKPVKERKVFGKVVIDIEKCKGCELCKESCKENGLTLSKTLNLKGYQYMIADNDLCTGCVNCALVCPDAVITVYRTSPKGKKKKVTDPEEVKESLKAILSNPAYPDLMAMDYI